MGMLDARTDCLLIFINDTCREGSYRIFRTEELVRAFPAKYAVDSEGLFLMLDYLCARDYVTVKYRDEETICLSPLPKGRLFHENAVSGKRRRILQVLSAVASGFCGGLIALLLWSLLC